MVFRLPRVTRFVTVFHVFLSVEDNFYDVVFFNVAIVSPWGGLHLLDLTIVSLTVSVTLTVDLSPLVIILKPLVQP